MAGSHLVSRAIDPVHDLNWRFLVLLLLSGSLTILFLFYFNRIIASLISLSLRTYTWRTYQVYLDLKSVQFSLLAGRVFFKGLRYHGENETILVTDGYITWRYWLRRVKEVDCDQSSKTRQDVDQEAELDSDPQHDTAQHHENKSRNQHKLPCRIEIQLRGLEWFIYNRTPAYESVLETVIGDSSSLNADGEMRRRHPGASSLDISQEAPEKEVFPRLKAIHVRDSESVISKEEKLSSGSRAQSLQEKPDRRRSKKAHSQTPSLPNWLRFLPIGLQCSKVGIVMGNVNTRPILTAKCKRLCGQISAGASGPLDLYKQIIELDIIQPIVQIKSNKAYRTTDTQHQTLSSFSRSSPWKRSLRLPPLLRKIFISVLPNRLKYRSSAGKARSRVADQHDEISSYAQHRWLGLERYLDEEDDRLEQERWKAVEYARSPVLLDAPRLALDIHWDVPGIVTAQCATIQRDKAPDWGIKVRLCGGNLSYGPWADRQRLELQNTFFPPTFKNMKPIEHLAIGQVRMSTNFKLLIEFEDDTVLRIPARESSKDSKWRGKANLGAATGPKGERNEQTRREKKSAPADVAPDSRPFGWQDVCLPKNTTATFNMDMVARHDGYQNHLTIDVPKPQMTTSVNHDLLWKANSMSIVCELPNPLNWNDLHQWEISVKAEALQMFLLRDHIFLMNDLVSDWNSGPLGGFSTFAPYKYLINLRMEDFKFYLNVNERNVINNPANLEDNNFVMVKGQDLQTALTINSSKYRPITSSVKFSSALCNSEIEISTSQRNTYWAFLESPTVGILKTVQVDGVFNYHTVTSPDLKDSFFLTINGESPRMVLYGFLIRYIMKIKDNYFGDDIHFRTFDELQQEINATKDSSAEVEPASQHGKLSNDLDVIIRITAVRPYAFLPCAIYSANESIKMEMSSITADLCFTSHYMELALNISPASLSCGPLEEHSATQLFLDGAEVFGHRLFGLPPTEPTYVCNWDFSIGSILGECSSEFLLDVGRAGRAFRYTLEDAENILPLGDVMTIHDVTFLRADIMPLTLWTRLEEHSVLLQTGKVIVDFDDWADARISNKGQVIVPDLVLALVNTLQAIKPVNHHLPGIKPLAYAEFSILISSRQTEHGHDRSFALQQEHIKKQDSRTYRTPWLIRPRGRNLLSDAAWDQKVPQSTSDFVPPLPEPVVLPCRGPKLRSLGLSSRLSYKGHQGSSTQDSSRIGGSTGFLASSGTPRRLSSKTGSWRQRSKLIFGARSPERQAINNLKRPLQYQIHAPKQTTTSKSGNRSRRTRFGFSSPYKRPYFALHSTILNLDDVPKVNTSSEALRSDKFNILYQRFSSESPSVKPGTSGTAFELGQVVKVFCTWCAMNPIKNGLNSLSTTQPTAILDDLQMETTTEVLDRITQTKQATTLDISLRLQTLSAKVVLNTRPSDDSHMIAPTVHAKIRGLVINGRRSKRSGKEALLDMDSSTILHSCAKDVDIRFYELSDITNSYHSTLAVASLTGPLFWAAFDRASRKVSIEVHNATFEAQGDRISCFLLILDQMKTSFIAIGQNIRGISQTRQSPRKHLVLSLASHAVDISSPAFLASGTFITRLTSEHIRTSDSWKILSRLRQILCSLPESARESLDSSHSPMNINDIEIEALRIFEECRTWDMMQVRQSILMKLVFGHSIDDQNVEATRNAAIYIFHRIGRFRVLAMFGNIRNELLFDELDLSIEPSSYATRSGSIGSNVQPLIHVRFSIRRTSLYTTWELCGLLNKLMNDRAPAPSKQPSEAPRSAQKYRIQLIFVLNSVSISFNAINTKSSFQCNKLHVSALQASHGVFHLCLASELLLMEQRGHLRKLLKFTLQRPRTILNIVDDKLDVFGLCEHLDLRILEDPFFLMKLMQTVLRDEVAVIIPMVQSLRRHARAQNSMSSVPVAAARVVLILHYYTLNFKILSSLHYALKGQAAKSSVGYSSRSAAQMLCCYDVLRYVHAFHTTTNQDAEMVSAFRFPPMYGNVKMLRGTKTRTFITRGIVDNIHFDAHPVHALLVLLNRPEVASFASQLQRESQNFLNALQQVPRQNRVASPQTVDTDISTLYDISLNMAGLSIHAAAPRSQKTSGKVKLRLDLGGLYLKAKNIESMSDIGAMPDIQIKLVGTGAHIFQCEGNVDKPAGDVKIQAIFKMSEVLDEERKAARVFQIQSRDLGVNLEDVTIPLFVEILGHLQLSLKEIDLSQEVNTLRKLRHPSRVSQADLSNMSGQAPNSNRSLHLLLNAMYSLDMSNLRVIWKVGDSTPRSPIRQPEDLVLSLSKIQFATRQANVARLYIRDVQLQMTPWVRASGQRSPNSALLPEMVFNVAYMSNSQNRRLAFYAAGKSLDLRLNSRFILPANDLRRSIANSVEQVRLVTSQWHFSALQSERSSKHMLGDKDLASLQIDADFAGAVVHIEGSDMANSTAKSKNMLRINQAPQRGTFAKVSCEEAAAETTLRSPGIAFKVHYKATPEGAKSLSAETKVSASSNTLHPRIVPVIMDITSSIKEMVGEPSGDLSQSNPTPQPPNTENASSLQADPSSIFGDCYINLGLRIGKQDFGLTCQPFAKVAATAQLDEIYITVNTVKNQDESQDDHHFYSLSGTVTNLTVGVQHAYSREPTGQLILSSVFISMINSRHIRCTEGISIILMIGPAKTTINARQIQDVLLFQDIWMPSELRRRTAQAEPTRSPEAQAVMIQRYQQVAAANAFPWNAIVRLEELDIQLDLGQSLGKSSVSISRMWMSSNKSSQAEQNLCFGLNEITGHSIGRMSGLITIKSLKLRTSIRWPIIDGLLQRMPLIQASASLEQFKIKAGLDYQAFAVAVITGFDFLMYNVRNNQRCSNDHLVAILKSETVQTYCTTLSASQALALWQAGERFVAEKQSAYRASLSEVERYLQRRPSLVAPPPRRTHSQAPPPDDTAKAPSQLRTRVVVALDSINFGAFPSTFSDNQIFRLQALDVSARFSSLLEGARIQSNVGLKLGRFRISLSPVTQPDRTTAIEDLSIEDVVTFVMRSQGGTILNVPMIFATMQTWQNPQSRHIDYIFRSSFQGRVDVGWSYARISFIRGMWNSHARALAQRFGKPLPKSAVQITGGPKPEGEEAKDGIDPSKPAKITAVVNVPLSKYTYTALEPPVIDTPQLRDMGEATPPLEWIGLHRERLPNVIHQIVIVSLLEVAKEVEDAYARILGSSSV